MSQHDYNIADQDGASFLVDLNNLIAAVVTMNSGATAPVDTWPFMFWVDTTSGKLKQRNAANDNWIEKGDLAAVDWGFLRKSNPTVTGLISLDDGADIASASTVDLTAATGNTVRITGTTAITAFTMNAGQQMELIAVGALPLTYNATTMNINGGVSYTCAAGDRLSVTKDGAGVVRVSVTKQDGSAVVASGLPAGTIIDFAGTSAPTGYLACPTSATNISRTTYANLFAAIGTTWGAGDGSTTFGMPFFPANYASVQANGNVGTNHVGENLAHTHTITEQVQLGGGGLPQASASAANPAPFTTSSSGGSANLAAGVRVLKCVKY